MTPKQRVLNSLNRKPVDRVPFSLGFGINPPVIVELCKYLQISPEELEAKLYELDDIKKVYPKYIGPPDREIRTDNSHTDHWGVTRHLVSYGSGYYYEISDYLLADIQSVEELEKYTFPCVDWFDYSTIVPSIERINQIGEYAIATQSANLFETSWYLRGFEQMFLDMYENPELFHAIMGRVTDFYMEYLTSFLDNTNGMIDIVFTADDIGGQDSLLLSLGMWEEFIKPYHVKLNKMLHERGVKVMYHTDGAVMDAVDGLIDMGVDILEALQFDAQGMDDVALKKKYGDRLCFHGGVSVQSTLPFGTVDDVHNEVLRRIEVLGKGGGYILAPSHAIQAETPPQNILKFIETGTGIDSANYFCL